MNSEMIKKEDWIPYFNFLSKATMGCQVMLEVVGEEIGDQIEEEWSFVEGLYFDWDTDTLYVRTEFIEHPIYSPRNVMIQDGGQIGAVGVNDVYGILQIIHFRAPLQIEGH